MTCLLQKKIVIKGYKVESIQEPERFCVRDPGVGTGYRFLPLFRLRVQNIAHKSLPDLYLAFLSGGVGGIGKGAGQGGVDVGRVVTQGVLQPKHGDSAECYRRTGWEGIVPAVPVSIS